jgi:O-succinylbenzoate synthase
MTFRLQFRRYRLPFKVPVRTAHGAWPDREGLFIRLEREDGTAGYGEAAPVPGFGTETTESVHAMLMGLGEYVDEVRLAGVPSEYGSLRQALATAMGGPAPAPANVPPYLAIAALLPAGKAALREIEPKAEIGFRSFKWKVGVGDIADELSLFDDVCAALPQGAKVRLDANGAWDRRQSERWLECCAERPVEFVEQPALSQPGAPAAHRARTEDLLRGLAQDFPTPIALDESLVGSGDVQRWLEAGWKGIYVLKPTLLGDSDEVMTRLQKAQADVVFSSALETALGAKAALRVAFRWHTGRTGTPRALGFGVWPLFSDERFNGPQAVPFIRAEDVERIDPEALWNALN